MTNDRALSLGLQDTPRPPLDDSGIVRNRPDSDFVGLHVHGQHSFLDGYASVKQIAERAALLGQKAVAITDHQEVGAHIMFTKACEKAGIKPILGMEGYLVDSYEEAVAEKYMPNKFNHITLLAKNNNGLRNLWAWSSDAYQHKRYRRALQDWKGVEQFGADLMASDGCLLAWMAQAIIADDEERCHELMSKFLGGFGDNFYMELHTFQFVAPETDENFSLNDQMTKVNKAKVALANQYGVPLVVVNDAHYASPEEWENHNIIWEMSTGKNDDQTGRGKTAAHMMDDADLIHWMGKHGVSESVTREAIKNTAMIAEMCNTTIESQLRMPRITASDEDDAKLFIKTVEEGFERKVVQRGKDVEYYGARMKWETDLILEKRFGGYFNIVADYTKEQKAKMLIGPGRGSAGGSLDAWLMDITEVDPLKPKYKLPFERFINPDRSGFPDIDLDFPQSKRPQVKLDLADRFGQDNVVAIGTLTTLGPKGILKDLCRIWKIDFKDSQDISKIFDKARSNDPEKKDITWDEMMEQLEDPLRPYVERYPKLFQKMSEMVGMIRGSSRHASGILISNEPLSGILPVRITSKAGNDPISAFTMKEVEDLGFVKFDILGLRHLDTIAICLRLIKERHGRKIDPYLFDDPEYTDPAIWPAIWSGDTTGIFQLETADMTRVAKRHKPNDEVEVADLISVNRPGVIYAGQLEPYLDRREGIEAPSYQNPETEKHLESTFGVLVYQEQIMEIVKDLAGFTPGQADSVRSAVSKKKQAELDAFHEKFVDGCLANRAFTEGSETGDPRADAEAIWRSIKSSGSYAFSRIHAIEYSMISCWEVWLRHYYYAEFVTALLTTDAKKDKDEPPKTAIYMRHARMHDVEILGPDINESRGEFQTTDNGIRYGLNFIKGIGEATTKQFLPMQPFKSFDDFLERTNVQRGAVFTLIKIGAFDCFGELRGDLWKRYTHLLINGVQQIARNDDGTPKIVKKTGEPKMEWVRKPVTKADREKLAVAEVPRFDTNDAIYEIEKELTGSFITRDPMAPYVEMIERTTIPTPEMMEALQVGQSCIVAGTLVKRKDIMTKKNDPMCFLGVEWNYQTFDITVFPKEFASNKFLFELDKPVACRVTRLARGVHLTECERLDYIIGDQ